MDQTRRRELLELAAASIEDDASPLNYDHFTREYQLTGTEMNELTADIADIVRQAARAD